MEFPNVIGASKGKPSRWIRVDVSEVGGKFEIHGHPIPEGQYKKYLKRG